jgi:hypothetical protein
MARLPRVVLWIAAVAFAGFGVAFAAFPHQMAAPVDIQLTTDTATTDYIATYGGFQIGFAVFLFLCLRRDDRVRLGLLASGCAAAGFAVSRALGILLFGDVRPVLTGVLVFEAISAAVAFWAARRYSNRDP